MRWITAASHRLLLGFAGHDIVYIFYYYIEAIGKASITENKFDRYIVKHGVKLFKLS